MKKYLIIVLITKLLFINLNKCVGLSQYFENNNKRKDDLLLRSRRQLLFPNSTLLQFNAGVGTPTPLKTINMNWAFQANFQCPWNRTQIPMNILDANSGYTGDSRMDKREANQETLIKERYDNNAELVHFYQYIEDILNGFGHNGTACVLRALCELGSEPLHSDDEEDVLHEIAVFVLNPKQKTNEESQGDEAVINPYITAYGYGESKQDCFYQYQDCSISLIDLFTIIY